MDEKSKKERDARLQALAQEVQTAQSRDDDDKSLREAMLRDVQEHQEYLRRSRERAPRRVFR
jgi:hypothetical protein